MPRSKQKGIQQAGPNEFIVQVSRNGERRTRRVSGTVADAERARAELLLELELPALTTTPPVSPGRQNLPTVKEWLRGRWAERSKLLHKATTANVGEVHVRYLIYYLGDRRLDEAVKPASVNWFVERRLKDPPLTFTPKKNGEARRPHVERVSNSTINASLCELRSAANLAFKEGVLSEKPQIEFLPEDDVRPIIPPSDTEMSAILKEAEKYRAAAPVLPEAVELSTETGARKEELFRLTWGSVDMTLGPNREGAIRIEEQGRGRLVGGNLWVPKNRRSRVVPLSPRAREILDTMRQEAKPKPTDLVFPNTHGCPYVRTTQATKGDGMDTWRIIKSGMGHTVRWHDLRHLFAVRCLHRGVPLALVSQWLGHSDVNLTVKRYGRFAAEAREQWTWINKLGQSVEDVALARRPQLKLASTAGALEKCPS